MMPSISPVKRVAAIHDLSGFGRCALTVVIPVLSVMGMQCVPMPTAVLSTHTGGYEDFSFLDLTDQMRNFSRHWGRLGLRFDAVYSGFLGSREQFGVVGDFISDFRNGGTLVLVDPVMGDGGKPYSTITPDMIRNMRSLASRADIITPNLTEAFFLLDRPQHGFADGPLDTAAVGELLFSLAETGPRKVVITGIRSESDIATACLDMDGDKKAVYHSFPAVDRDYPGTGDIFASVLLGRLLAGDTLSGAAMSASKFVRDVIVDTAAFDLPPREGVLLERSLGRLANGV